jgi:UDP-N-acetylglucosamine--N-acetylmuramyl-(pentapeptide) pyrophosphoryl-undecaprenol N-acetylglucosamine transferase
MQLETARPASGKESALPKSMGRMSRAPATHETIVEFSVPEEARTLRVLVVAGGTGGHIFPALAVAEELLQRSPAARFQFLGTARGLETRLIEGAGFPYRALAAAGLKGIHGWRLIRNATLLPRTFAEAGSALASFRPDVVMGMGGYVTGPVLLEAALAGIPTLLVEPNASPGLTNRALGPVVTLAAIGFGETERSFGSKARLTGIPVRRAFFEILPKNPRPPFTILIFGGSQGSAGLNHALVESVPRLTALSAPFCFIHQTGEREERLVRKAYRQANVPAEVHAFIDDMPAAFARADLVISRAGASTVAELAAAGKASLLIPFPAATDRHQLENARAFERAGAARVVEQAELTPEGLARELADLLGASERLVRMGEAARRLARPDAAARIADLIEGLAAMRREGGVPRPLPTVAVSTDRPNRSDSDARED